MSDISLNDFKKNLEGGKYGSIAGARRGIGKIQGWDDATRDQARKIVDKHFGEAPAPKVKQAAAAPADQKRRPGRPPGSKNKAKQAAPAKQAAKPAKAAPKQAAKQAAPVKKQEAKAPQQRAARKVDKGDKVAELSNVVGSISEALTAIKMCGDIAGKPVTAIEREATAASRILGAVIRELGSQVVTTGVEEQEDPEAKRRQRKTPEQPLPNGASLETHTAPVEEQPAVS